MSGVPSSLKLFELKLEILTPTAIASRVGYAGFVHMTLVDHIPGPVLRGALLSEALRSGSLSREDVNKLSVSPDFALTPLLAIGRRGENLNSIKPLKSSLVAHALCYMSKWPDERTIRSPGAVKLVNKRAWELIKELVKAGLRSRKPGWGLGEVRSVEGKPTRKVGNLWEAVKTGGWTTAYIEVGLDRSRGSSAPGVLYAYEFLKPGCTYAGLMAVREESFLMKFLDEMGPDLRLYIGRGVSRGFGKARLVLKDIDLKEIQVEWIKSDLGDEKDTVLMALSPVFVEDGEFPLPTPPREGSTLALDPGWYATMLGKPVNVKFKVKSIYGRRRASHAYRGWSLRTGMPKAPIRALGMGSLLVCKVKGTMPAHTAFLLPILGLGPSSSMGFNQLAPLKQDPFGGEST